MSYVPEELVVEVLTRLPAESLLRFRCVSKSWRALIDSPDFIKAHLHQARKSKTDRKLISRDCSIHSVNLDILDTPNASAEATVLRHPLDPEDTGNGTGVLGCCDGIICLCEPEEKIVLWNLTTRRYKKLPLAEIELSDDQFFFCECLIYGFGYDCRSDDYKVVRMIQYFENKKTFGSEVKVYSLKSNSWRRIGDFSYYLRYKRGHGVLVNGALHWVVSRKPESHKKNLIAAFDLGTEEFLLVPQPAYKGKKFRMNVEVLDGRLCVLCNYYEHHVDLWRMEEYGIKESWIRLFRVGRTVDIPFFDHILPIASSKNRARVLLAKDGEQLMWYNLGDKSVTHVFVRGPVDFDETWTTFGSLVRLGDGESYRKEKKTQERRKKKRRDDFLSTGFKLVL